MAFILPRLRLSNTTAANLRQEADQRGVNVADVIAELVERQVNNADAEDETLYRIIHVAERFGLGVGGNTTYPADWVTIGGMSDEKCRDVAAKYHAWRQERLEKQQRIS